jgi:hypothetical protein
VTVRIAPDRHKARLPLVVPISRGDYFAQGGFVIGDTDVTVRARSGRCTTVLRDRIRGVAFTSTSGGRVPDWRILLTDASGVVLAQDQALFYDDDDLALLAQTLGCDLARERFSNFKALAQAHPGVFRFRWEARPIATALVFGVALLVLVWAVIGVTRLF